MITLNIPDGVDVDVEALTAASGLEFVARRIDQGPEVFDIPKFSGPTRLAKDAHTGQIAGHIAQKGVCHTNYRRACVEAPMSKRGWAPFHREAVALPGNTLVAVGRLTSGGPHASIGPMAMAIGHHDRLRTWGLVVAQEDEYGIAVAGIQADGVPESLVAENLQLSQSGDWRRWAAELELIEALTVERPAYPIYPTGELVASEQGVAFSYLQSVGVLLPEGETAITASGGCGCPDDEAEVEVEAPVEPQRDLHAEALALLDPEPKRLPPIILR